MTVKPLDRGWAIGLWEGEGSVTVQGNNIRLSMNSTDHDVLLRLQALLGGKLYGPYVNPGSLGKKVRWHWVLYGTKAVEWVDQNYPWFSERRQHQVDAATEKVKAIRARWYVEKVCPTCGITFVPWRPNYATRTIYCSKRCNAVSVTRRYRQRKAQASREA